MKWRRMRRTVRLLAELIGDSPGVAAVRTQAEQLLSRHSQTRRLRPVVTLGETVTGKSEVARCSYRFDRRAPRESAMFRPPVAGQRLPRDRTHGSGPRSLMFFLFAFLFFQTGWEQALDEQVATGLAAAFIACDDPNDDGGDDSK